MFEKSKKLLSFLFCLLYCIFSFMSIFPAFLNGIIVKPCIKGIQSIKLLTVRDCQWATSVPQVGMEDDANAK